MKKNNLAVNIIMIVFTLIGIGLMIGGLVAHHNHKAFQEKADKIEAVITDINVYTTGTGKNRTTHHEVYIEYEYEGRFYENQLSTYSSSMARGKTITIYVNPDDPTDVEISWGGTFITLILCGMGAVFFLIGFLTFVIVRKTSGKGKKLMRNGQQVKAQIRGFDVNYHVTVNGRNPYKVVCAAEVRGETLVFTSDNIYYEVSLYYRVGDFVNVYIDPYNTSKYYVDIPKNR